MTTSYQNMQKMPTLRKRDPAPPSPRRARPPALGVIALLAVFALLAPAPAEAQSAHVTNLGQTASSNRELVNASTSKAIAFTTGGATSNGFTLNSVVVKFAARAATTTVSVFSNSSSNRPGTRIGNSLTKSGIATSGDILQRAHRG